MTRNTTILLAILVALIGVYWYFFTGTAPQAPLSANAPTDVAEQQFIDLANRLSLITFDTSIFEDPRFDLLVSLATPIAPEPSGRIDPFAPLSR